MSSTTPSAKASHQPKHHKYTNPKRPVPHDTSPGPQAIQPHVHDAPTQNTTHGSQAIQPHDPATPPQTTHPNSAARVTHETGTSPAHPDNDNNAKASPQPKHHKHTNPKPPVPHDTTPGSQAIQPQAPDAPPQIHPNSAAGVTHETGTTPAHPDNDNRQVPSNTGILPGSLSRISTCTWNADGLLSQNPSRQKDNDAKRSNLTRLISKYAIVALQETHGSRSQWEVLINKLHNSHTVFYSTTPGNPNMGAVAIIVQNSILSNAIKNPIHTEFI